MDISKDVIGQAILDFSRTGNPADITVHSDLCDDDVIEVDYLFRTLEEMPDLEKTALNHCSGTILDVGAAAGAHAKELIKRGHTVHAIDISPGAVEYLHSQKIPAEQADFLSISGKTCDTILLLMNGIGIAGSLSRLESFLIHARNCLTPHGKIICDSTNVEYLYHEDDGSMWLDLNSEYFGNFKFQMSYKEFQTDWFDWLYVDAETLRETAEKAGLSMTLLYEHEDQFLAELTIHA